VLAVVTFAVYATIILGRADGDGLADVAYVEPMLWTIGGSIVGSIVLHALIGWDYKNKDQRDREIGRFGEYVGQSFAIIGALAALLMAMTEWDYFWIANVIYLCFVLSAVLGSITKIVSYRQGFPQW
jgi:membrane glycosyltransferase